MRSSLIHVSQSHDLPGCQRAQVRNVFRKRLPMLSRATNHAAIQSSERAVRCKDSSFPCENPHVKLVHEPRDHLWFSGSSCACSRRASSSLPGAAKGCCIFPERHHLASLNPVLSVGSVISLSFGKQKPTKSAISTHLRTGLSAPPRFSA